MKIFSWVDAIKKSSLPPVTRHVLLNLSTYMNQDGESCYPSIDEQARSTGLSRRSVIGHLSYAITAGFLYKTTHQFKGQKWRRNEYCAGFPKACELIRAEDVAAEGGERYTPRTVIIDEGGDRGAPEGGDRHDHKVVHDVHSNYSLNSPKETKEKKYTKTKLVTLQDWEAAQGCALNSSMISSWCREKGLYHPTITRLLEEFRIEMMSKGKQYADFKAAFQTYLMKGYLSLTLAGAQATSKREAAALDSTNVSRRGGDL